MAARSPADKLRSSLPGVPGRGQFSSSTRRALITQAERLFTTQGYGRTSLDTIVKQAKVTKGALYHHFSGKQALFEAVFEKIEGEAAERVRQGIRGKRDPWEKARAGVQAFLEVVEDPSYQRVVIQEGPAVLGYERFREQEERSAFGVAQDLVRELLSESTVEVTDDMVEVLSRMFWGALSAAGESVSEAEDPKAMVVQVEAAVDLILAGIRALAEVSDPS